MAQIISVSIDLNKLDKSRIVEGKNGSKYYNLSVIVNDEKDQYGNDVSVTTAQTKEEREAKAQRTFVGNGRVIWSGQNNNNLQSNQTPSNQYQKTIGNDTDDSLPF